MVTILSNLARTEGERMKRQVQYLMEQLTKDEEEDVDPTYPSDDEDDSETEEADEWSDREDEHESDILPKIKGVAKLGEALLREEFSGGEESAGKQPDGPVIVVKQGDGVRLRTPPRDKATYPHKRPPKTAAAAAAEKAKSEFRELGRTMARPKHHPAAAPEFQRRKLRVGPPPPAAPGEAEANRNFHRRQVNTPPAIKMQKPIETRLQTAKPRSGADFSAGKQQP